MNSTYNKLLACDTDQLVSSQDITASRELVYLPPDGGGG